MMMRFFLFSFFAAFMVFQTQAENQNLSKPPAILYFIGRIEIVYPNSPSVIIKTGEKPPALESGTILRVLEGKLSLETTNDKGQVSVQEYAAGQAVRIGEAKGNWVAATANSLTFQGSQSSQTNLSSPGQEQTESEIVQEAETPTIAPSTTEEEEEETSVSPS